jgi:hypothetical protein
LAKRQVGGEGVQADKETEKGEDRMGRELRSSRATTKEMEDHRLQGGKGFASRGWRDGTEGRGTQRERKKERKEKK